MGQHILVQRIERGIVEIGNQHAFAQIVQHHHMRDSAQTAEGARILGQLYAQQNKLEQAHALLLPYVEERLKKYHEVEKRLTAAEAAIVINVQAGSAAQQ